MTSGAPRRQDPGALRVLAARPWPGSAIAVSPDGAWVAVALPARVVVARLPDLDGVREIAVPDVRSLAAVDPGRLALAPRRGLLVIADPRGGARVGIRARTPGRLALAAGPDGRLAAVGARAALPRATVVAWSDGARRREWTAALASASVAAWLAADDLAVAVGDDLLLVRRGEEIARATSPLGEPITALASVPGGVVLAGAGDRAVVHTMIPGVSRRAITIPPGTARSLAAAPGILTAATRSGGERVSIHDLPTGAVIARLRGVAAAVPVPPYVVATGREGTVVVGP